MSEISPGLQELGIRNFVKNEGKPVNGLKPIGEITPLVNLSHLERHWTSGLGSEFIANEYFSNAESMARLLEAVTEEVVTVDTRNRSAIVTLEFASQVGKLGVTEIVPGEPVSREIRDPGAKNQIEVNVVTRAEMPSTNLVTFEMRPVFPKKGSGGSVTYQLWSSFPGGPSPSLMSKEPADVEYWRTHAFVKVSPQSQ